ncbi:dihydropteroate synthase FolP [Gottschalkia acidurici 9a]|uniref:Dihydropteroate synthase n=1 Tax=Gottschalkia acidurici (strain ATCC 7906 / DSM 604 / BCRC 14475 / CIP 104303 / KCTC 5404 / NCIMB 10678 / 9a) TaxID=1128398 RepID=K0B2F1_GOTA9|nr:dihydropteroate synthase [Gottschalkia acidurici]AFS79110.1 dihydropteroate synthase FolP [Gottschalkia acidurici 9a]
MKNLRKVDIDCGKYTLNLGTKTYIMGILNVTPDSFSDGGKYNEVDMAIERAKEMVEQGADIIDIGGESTRPGHTVISVEEELSRLVPVIEKLSKEVEAPISVDTYKSEVADGALKAGAHMINDIWGLQKDPNMANVIAKHNAPVVIMHNQDGTEYKADIMEEMCRFLRKSISIALEAGVKPENIILDPGIGFGKTSGQNIEVMDRLDELNYLGYPVLLGTSRKSMIGKILDLEPEQRVEGTIATSVMGTIKGVDIVRVHDVVENYRALKVTDAIVRGNMPWIE